MVQRYRPHKIKLRHHVLDSLMPVLERLAAYPEITAITPGVIAPKRGQSVGLTVQYRTTSGLRLIGRSGGAAQEVYVVTQDPDTVVARMRADGLISDPGSDARGASLRTKPVKETRTPGDGGYARSGAAERATAPATSPQAGLAPSAWSESKDAPAARPESAEKPSQGQGPLVAADLGGEAERRTETEEEAGTETAEDRVARAQTRSKPPGNPKLPDGRVPAGPAHRSPHPTSTVPQGHMGHRRRRRR